MLKKNSSDRISGNYAALAGLMSRVHGILGLHGVSFEDRFRSLEKWCSENTKIPEPQKAPWAG